MLLRLTTAFLAGVVLHFPDCLWLAPVLCLVWPRSWRRAAAWLLPVSLALLSGAWQPQDFPDQIASSSRLRVQGWIAERPTENRQSSSQRCLLRVQRMQRIDSQRLVSHVGASHVLLRSQKPLPAYGTRIEVEGNFEPPRPRRNFYGMDEIAFLRSRNAAGTLYAKDFTLLKGAGGEAWRRQLTEPWRNHLAAHIEQTLQGMPRGLLLALVLGIRSDLDASLRDAWRALGLSHVLALSGMHVGVVAAGLLALAGNVRRAGGLLFLVAGVFAYAAVGGLGSSVLRASLMVVGASLALYLGRSRHPLRNLGTTALVLTAATPHRLTDLGFQLSCSATLGILIVAAPMARWALSQRRHHWALRAVAWMVPVAVVGLAAQIVTLPWILHHFGYVSWVSPLSNLLLVPVVDVALVLGLSGAALSLVLPWAARSLWLVSGALLQFVGWVSLQLVGCFDPRVFLRNHPLVIVAAALAAVTFVVGMLLRGRRRALLLILSVSSITSVFLLGTRTAAPDWQVDMLNVGQGDAFLLRFGGDSWLIDAGPSRPVDQGERTVVPHLQREGIDHLAGIIVSHPHLDHYGGIASVLSQVRVDSLYLATASWDHPVYRSWRQRFANVPQRRLALGDVVSLGHEAQALVLWPPDTDVLQSGANGVSVSLWVRSPRGPSLLCMGDLEMDGEQALLQAWGDSLRHAADDFLILKAGHHGSDTSSSPAFLDAVDPEIALVSAGRRNRYGHPSPETLLALRQRLCVTLRTDEGGDIRLQRRGTSLWVRRPSQRPQPFAAPEDGIDALPGR